MQIKGFQAIIQLDRGIEHGKAKLQSESSELNYMRGYVTGIKIACQEDDIERTKGFEDGWDGKTAKSTNPEYVKAYNSWRREWILQEFG